MRRALVLALAFGACKPDLGPGDAQITALRVLAVRAEPAEVKPGSVATFTALVVDPTGTVSGAPVTWSFCHAPKPLSVDNVVAAACVDRSALDLVAVGPAINATIPGDACRLFGPDTPPGGYRPRDPDETGGYYQPVRADLPGTDAAFDLVRVTCELANAPADAVEAFGKAYVPNANPAIGPLGATIDGAGLPASGIPAGARVVFTVGWDPASAETYAWFDPAAQAVTTKRESMRVAWYASAGALDTQSTGRAEDDLATSTSNAWTAPTGLASATTVHLWIVLRDSRGGLDFATYDLPVVP